MAKITDTENALELVKKNIRSLLVSVPLGLTLEEIRNDYEEYFGDVLPSRKFGCQTDEEFLRGMPDVVTIERTWDCRLAFKATFNENTQHIAKMVANQRVERSKWAVANPRRDRNLMFRKGSSGGRGRSFATPPRARHQPGSQQIRLSPPLYQFYQFPLRPSQRLEYGNQQALQSPPYHHQSWSRSTPVLPLSPPGCGSSSPKTQYCTLPTIPAFIQDKIQEFLAMYPDGIPVNFFDRAFKKWAGMEYDLQQVTIATDIETVVAVIPEIAKIEEYQHGEKRVLGVQSPQVPVNIRTKCVPGSGSEPLFSDSSRCKREKSTERAMGDDHQASQLCSEDQKSRECTIASYSDGGVGDISLELQNKVKEILLKRPNGIWSSRLPFDYKAFWKEDLPFKEQGFLSVIDFVSAMPHVVYVERPEPKGDWLLSDASLVRKKGAAPVRPEKEHSAGGNASAGGGQKSLSAKSKDMDEELQESVRQVLQVHPEGVLVQDFQKVYEEKSGRKMDPKALGYADLYNLLISLSDVLYIEYGEKNTSRLFCVPGKGPRRFDYLLDKWKPHTLGDDREEPVPFAEDDIPEDAVGPGVCYTPVPLPETQGEHFEICVSNIVSPGLFWIQLHGSKTTGALEQLMNGLDFYKDHGELYRMPERLMTYGQVCATLFPEDNNWHRGIITSNNESGMIEMYYVDYGSTCYVPKSSIRFLRKQFLRLPTQAIQAELAYTKPTGEKWALAAKDRMLELCRCRALMALMTGRTGRVLSLVLCDTSGATDIHINDTLVNEKLAVFEYPTEEEEGPAAEKNEAGREGSNLYVQQVDFGNGFNLHIINFENELYLTSGEVSSLFWEEDIIGSMLVKHKFHLKKLFVKKDEYPCLFEELLRFNVWNVSESTQILSLYSLNGLPQVLEMFGQGSLLLTELKTGVEEFLHSVEPEDTSEWRDQNEDMSHITSEEQLSLAINSLQILRKRILKAMMSASECSPCAIQELDRVEQTIKHLQSLLSRLDDTPSFDVVSVESQTPSASTTSTSTLATDKPQASLNKNTVPPSVADPAASSVRTNVVPPLIVQPAPDRAAAQPQASEHGLTASGDLSLSQLMAANLQMASIIQQQETFLRSMLQTGANPQLNAASQMPSTPSRPQLLPPSTPLGARPVAPSSRQGASNPLLMSMASLLRLAPPTPDQTNVAGFGCSGVLQPLQTVSQAQSLNATVAEAPVGQVSAPGGGGCYPGLTAHPSFPVLHTSSVGDPPANSIRFPQQPTAAVLMPQTGVSVPTTSQSSFTYPLGAPLAASAQPACGIGGHTASDGSATATRLLPSMIRILQSLTQNRTEQDSQGLQPFK